jgi:ubiquinol-cytochrome c reductase cytochrome c subunit
VNSLAWRRRPAASFALLLAALTATGIGYALFHSPSAGAAGVPGSDSSIAAGRALFAEGCATCHGLNAEGTSVAPSLVGAGAAAVDFQVSTGRMPLAAPVPQAPRKAPQYDPVQISQMADFVASLGPGPEIPSAADLDTTNADLVRGGELFRTNCAQCHNFAGSGAALTQGKYAPSLMEAQPKDVFQAMLTGPQNMPVFGNGTLSVSDKQDILKYVGHLQTQVQPGGLALGGFGPVTEGLFVFIAFAMLFGAATVWIGAKLR